MNYAQTIDFLYSKLPMFTRVGAAAIKKDLHNTLVMCAALDNPHEKFKSIHIGGTNGKGSTSHMLAAVLQQAGYKTGLYTSPHLKDFRERIKINGKMIPKTRVTSFVSSQKKLIEQIEPSFFEVTVAMAFDYFAQEKVDFAIIEVGLGGRLDSTNIITPELSVITNISFDHVQLLGDTYAAIAFEKAGIIKSGIPVVIGERHPETAPVFNNKAKAEKSPISFAQDLITVKEISRGRFLTVDVLRSNKCVFPALRLDLTGSYQLKNLCTVINALLLLQDRGVNIPETAIYSALRQVKKLTGLQGRWQVLGKNPFIIADTGHNEAGINEVLHNISLTKHDQLHFVIGMVKDKDISAVLKLLPKKATYYFCAPQLERALTSTQLRQQAKSSQLNGMAYESVPVALAAAKANAKPEDLIFVGGSTFVVAEIL
ncbi:MAG: folylpolyglutamate synthase/dihydrofolate synthase family protein [Pedobacter sp.]|nr:folylpolyglutamate synthase/dihydrofolate synthase family protein [Pedobacter sp.]MDQ8053840.1 folylpolyglutamate synthase/dihydrofolate synthase family protein [Pedobacter sp.]